MTTTNTFCHYLKCYELKKFQLKACLEIIIINHVLIKNIYTMTHLHCSWHSCKFYTHWVHLLDPIVTLTSLQ